MSLLTDGMARLFGRSQPVKPDGGYLIALGQTTAGIAVHSVEKALSYPAVWACVRVVAESIAGLPWKVYRRRPDGTREPMEEHPVANLLNRRPCSEMGAFEWRESMMAAALLWGDAYAEIERDLSGRPIGLWPIEPHRVEIKRDDAGVLYYEVRNENSGPTLLREDDVYHIHGLGPTGLHGYYVVALFREAIGLGLATQEQAAAFFGNAGMPSGFLTHPGMVDAEKAKELLTNFEARHRGPQRRSRVGLLQGGLAYVPVATTNEDAELDKSRTFQILEACRIFRVPPHKVAELSRATFSNIAEQETAFGRDTVLPWAQRLEQEADAKLFVANVGLRQPFYSRLNVDAIMRGDPKARAEFYEIMQRIGAMSPNEIRAKEDLDPIGTDGDQYLVPANFTTLERLAEPPPEPQAPPPQFDVTEPAEEVPAAAEGDTQEAARMLVRDLVCWLGRTKRKEIDEESRRCRMGSPDADRSRYTASLSRMTNWTSGLLAGRLGVIGSSWATADGREECGVDFAEIGKDLALGMSRLAEGGYVEGLYGAEWIDRTTETIMDKLGGPTNGQTE